MEPKLLVTSGSRHTSGALPVSRLLLSGIKFLCACNYFEFSDHEAKQNPKWYGDRHDMPIKYPR